MQALKDHFQLLAKYNRVANARFTWRSTPSCRRTVAAGLWSKRLSC